MFRYALYAAFVAAGPAWAQTAGTPNFGPQISVNGSVFKGIGTGPNQAYPGNSNPAGYVNAAGAAAAAPVQGAASPCTLTNGLISCPAAPTLPTSAPFLGTNSSGAAQAVTLTAPGGSGLVFGGSATAPTISLSNVGTAGTYGAAGTQSCAATVNAYGQVSGWTCSAITPAGIGAEQVANKGVANGYAPLNSSGQVPSGNLPAGTTATAGIVQLGQSSGQAYPGNNPGGFITASGAPVQTVAGRTGAITLTHSDLTDWSSAFGTAFTAALTPAAIGGQIGFTCPGGQAATAITAAGGYTCAAFGGALTIPNASLLSGNGTALGSVGIDASALAISSGNLTFAAGLAAKINGAFQTASLTNASGAGLSVQYIDAILATNGGNAQAAINTALSNLGTGCGTLIFTNGFVYGSPTAKIKFTLPACVAAGTFDRPGAVLFLDPGSALGSTNHPLLTNGGISLSGQNHLFNLTLLNANVFTLTSGVWAPQATDIVSLQAQQNAIGGSVAVQMTQASGNSDNNVSGLTVLGWDYGILNVPSKPTPYHYPAGYSGAWGAGDSPRLSVRNLTCDANTCVHDEENTDSRPDDDIKNFVLDNPSGVSGNAYFVTGAMVNNVTSGATTGTFLPFTGFCGGLSCGTPVTPTWGTAGTVFATTPTEGATFGVVVTDGNGGPVVFGAAASQSPNNPLDPDGYPSNVFTNAVWHYDGTNWGVILPGIDSSTYSPYLAKGVPSTGVIAGVTREPNNNFANGGAQIGIVAAQRSGSCVDRYDAGEKLTTNVNCVGTMYGIRVGGSVYISSTSIAGNTHAGPAYNNYGQSRPNFAHIQNDRSGIKWLPTAAEYIAPGTGFVRVTDFHSSSFADCIRKNDGAPSVSQAGSHVLTGFRCTGQVAQYVGITGFPMLMADGFVANSDFDVASGDLGLRVSNVEFPASGTGGNPALNGIATNVLAHSVPNAALNSAWASVVGLTWVSDAALGYSAAPLSTVAGCTVGALCNFGGIIATRTQ